MSRQETMHLQSTADKGYSERTVVPRLAGPKYWSRCINETTTLLRAVNLVSLTSSEGGAFHFYRSKTCDI